MCQVSAALSRSTLSPSVPIRLLNKLPTHVTLLPSFFSYVACQSRSMRRMWTRSPAAIQALIVDAELIDARSDLDAAQRVAAMHHGTFKRPPKERHDCKIFIILILHDIGQLERRIQAVTSTQAHGKCWLRLAPRMSMTTLECPVVAFTLVVAWK